VPIDYRKYPSDWKTAIRPRILARHGHRCQCCGVANHLWGFRDAGGKFHELPGWSREQGKRGPGGVRVFQIMLNVVHLDHGLTDHSDSNLGTMCQRCHGNYDKPITAAQAAYTNKYPGAAATLTLPLLP
jgi:hypothetical protein